MPRPKGTDSNKKKHSPLPPTTTHTHFRRQPSKGLGVQPTLHSFNLQKASRMALVQVFLPLPPPSSFFFPLLASLLLFLCFAFQRGRSGSFQKRSRLCPLLCPTPRTYQQGTKSKGMQRTQKWGTKAFAFLLLDVKVLVLLLSTYSLAGSPVNI